MSQLVLGVAIAIALLMALNLIRTVKGPTIFDRLVGVNVIGVNGVLLIIVLGVVFNRLDMFIDLALVYALLNFVGVVGVSKYLENAQNGDASTGGGE